ncbi:MAG: DUF465 domain-containing protein [Candidatus Aminicenantes bacterium]|nr:DUF465 domain-containing protein [Candidatus Aminicenantes bacterium]
MDEVRLKERLLAESAEFRKLFEEHQIQESRLAGLAAKPFLSPAEELEEKDIKKRKLALKDRMYLLMREAQKTHP